MKTNQTRHVWLLFTRIPSGGIGLTFLIAMNLEDGDVEQLWVRRLADDQFEISCIPFFAYDVSLGDTVEAALTDDERYVFRRVTKDAGLYVVRIWFGEVADLPARHDLINQVTKRMSEFGCEQEWSSHDLLAVAVDPRGTQLVADYLWEKQAQNELTYETGRTL